MRLPPLHRVFGLACFGLACLFAAAQGAYAQASSAASWPQKPVRLVLPYPPGGSADAISRLIGQYLTSALGQQVIVDNRPGANGAIAAEAAARAPADGYTLFFTPVAQLAIVPLLQKTRYDPIKDFVPISIVTTNALVLTVGSGVPAKNLREFVEYAQQSNGSLQFASSGDGGIPHLTAVMFFSRAGLNLIHVPYKGNAQILNDVMGGHVPVYFANLPEVLPLVGKSGVRFLGQTGEERAPQLPEVPTIAEQGYPGYKSLTWGGVMAPAGTPKAVVDRLAELLIAFTKDPGIIAKMGTLGIGLVGSTPKQFEETLRADMANWAQVVRASGLKME
jgi:tripartite-type tricarboxylate transporter receptor subunit TctC